MFDTLKALTQNTTPKISLVIHNEYLDRVGDEQPARFTTITWQWSDETLKNPLPERDYWYLRY